MKFIFPQNYNFKSKILGFIDYSTAIFDILWGIIVIFILNMLHFKLKVKIFIFIVLVFPVFLFSIFGFYGENIISVFVFLFKFLTKPKILLFKK